MDILNTGGKTEAKGGDDLELAKKLTEKGSLFDEDGIINGKPTSGVWLLDCRSHTWHHVPSMGMARASATAGIVDGKIYVFGGCQYHKDYSKWGEVFNPKTQTWDTLSVPDNLQLGCFGWICDSGVMNAKIYGVTRLGQTIYYLPIEAKWGRRNWDLDGGTKRGWCVIDKVLYACDTKGRIMWCDQEELDKTEARSILWKQVKGLASLRKRLSRSRLVHYVWENGLNTLDITTILEGLVPGAKLGNSGGNIVVFWDVLVGGLESLEIWCAEISLERRTGGHIWGTILSSNAVMELS